jgi:hypothetical protein
MNEQTRQKALALLEGELDKLLADASATEASGAIRSQDVVHLVEAIGQLQAQAPAHGGGEFDLGRLTLEELKTMRDLREKARVGAPPAPAPVITPVHVDVAPAAAPVDDITAKEIRRRHEAGDPAHKIARDLDLDAGDVLRVLQARS